MRHPYPVGLASMLMTTLVVATTFSSHASCQETTPWTAEVIVDQVTARGWSLSNDGRLALWLRSKQDKEKDKAISTLMLTDVATGEHRELTVGKDDVSAPQFSPDATRIAFLSSRDLPDGTKGPSKEEKGAQVWTLDLRGGEPRPITTLPFGVGDFAWHDDNTIFLTARERATHQELSTRKAKDNSVVVEDDERYFDASRRLFRFELKTKKLKRVTNNVDRLTSFAVSPDGRYVVALHQTNPSFGADGRFPPRCVMHDLANGSARELYADKRSKPVRFAWEFDSSHVLVLYPKSSVDGEDSGAITVVHRVDVETLTSTELDLDHDWGVTGPFVVCKDGFVTGLCNGASPLTARYYLWPNNPIQRINLDGTYASQVHSIAKARDTDQAIFIAGSASDPDHVFAARLTGASLVEEREIYRPNHGFEAHAIARTEKTRWKGADDDDVEGLLYYPHDFAPGERRPLVLITHGGPHGHDGDRFSERWSNSPNLYAERGAFVLKVNYHGSSNYGLEFGESIKGKYYEYELVDLFSGIAALVERGLVDPDRLGLVGWSNGAILSIAAVALADRYAADYSFDFKACAPGAGDVNWTSDYGNCAFGGTFDDYYLGGPPWELPELYLEKSPLFHVEKVTTPTLIFFGSNDTSVPTEQGWEWYRALHSVGKAPVRFVLFPDQPHGLGKRSHQLRKLEEELAWFDRYLFGKPPKVTPLVAPLSPLDVAEREDGIARVGHLFGVPEQGIIVPETLPFGDVEIGRFEVTRGQWAHFASTQGDLLRVNYPMADVDADEATAYVEWLTATTTSRWRLLTEAEFTILDKARGAAENDLDYWAGYSPSPTDAEAIAARVAQLNPFVSLFPVGSRPPGIHREKGREELFFDVGGNVAEWIVGDHGELRVAGGCALRSPDDRGEPSPPPLRFVGLRVVRERVTGN